MQRYLQQMAVEEIGIAGQDKLLHARVFIAGAGGLGTSVATWLAAAGIGHLGIVDGDKVSASNLHRQFLYHESNIGSTKATVLAQKLQAQNPGIQITAFPFYLTGANMTESLQHYDIVCDCTDNADSRILLDEYCGKSGKPLIYAAVKDWESYITVLHYKKKIALTDIFPAEYADLSLADSCSASGIINTTCGLAGSIQATEVYKILLGLEGVLDGEILCVNTLANVHRKFIIRKR